MIIDEKRKQLIQKYTAQKATLPWEVHCMVRAMTGEKVDVYTLCDLNDKNEFTEQWAIISQNRLIIVKKSLGQYFVDKNVDLKNLKAIREQRSLSGLTLSLIATDDTPPLAILRMTLRQATTMSSFKYVLESIVDQKEVIFSDGYHPDEEYSKALIRPLIDAQNSVTSENARTLWRLLSYLWPYKKELILGTLGATLTTMVSLIPAYVSGKLIDDIVKPFQDGRLSQQEALSMAWIFVSALGCTYLLREFFIWLRLNKMSVLGERVAKDLRDELYSHLQNLGLDFYSKKPTGSIISRVSSDTDRIWDFIAFGVVEVGISIITLIGLSLVLISMDVKLGLIMTLPVPLLLVSIYVHGERMKKMFIKAWRKWSALTTILSDTIPGIQVVKAFNQEQREIHRFGHKNDEITQEFNNIHDAWTKFWPLLVMSVHLITLSVWIFALPRLISSPSQEGHLSAGIFVSFLLYLTMFGQPIEIIGQVARMLNRALSSAYRIFEILDTRPSIHQVQTPLELKQISGSVQFRHVNFSYDGLRPVLNNLSFDVREGEMIGLVGESGGGKSTITKLLARFYDVDSGEILIDGKNLKQLPLGKFRRQVGMVLQEPYLFRGTIGDNIAYGLENIKYAQVIEAAKVANAHDFITKLPNGYDTVVGERGHTLSGGERQRVSIARAILQNPRILILDEATSAVDTETEHKIQEALDHLVKGRTVFAVAHRLSTLRKADRIFVIDKGCLIESGSHAELLCLDGGHYKKLYQLQQEMSRNTFLTTKEV